MKKKRQTNLGNKTEGIRFFFRTQRSEVLCASIIGNVNQPQITEKLSFAETMAVNRTTTTKNRFLFNYPVQSQPKNYHSFINDDPYDLKEEDTRVKK